MRNIALVAAMAVLAGCVDRETVYRPPAEVQARYDEAMAKFRAEMAEVDARKARGDAPAYPAAPAISAAERQRAADKEEWREAAMDACMDSADLQAYGSGLAYPLAYQYEYDKCMRGWERFGYIDGIRFLPYR